MEGFEIKKKFIYPRMIFYSDRIEIERKNQIIVVRTEDIDRIEYEKPGFWNYLMSSCSFGGTYPGRLEIYLNRETGGTTLYLSAIKFKDIFKLPDFYKKKNKNRKVLAC